MMMISSTIRGGTNAQARRDARRAPGNALAETRARADVDSPQMARPSRAPARHRAHGPLERIHVAHREHGQHGRAGHPALARLILGSNRIIHHTLGEKAPAPCHGDVFSDAVGSRGRGGKS